MVNCLVVFSIVTGMEPVFAYATLEMGIGVELCWPYQAHQKGSVRIW